MLNAIFLGDESKRYASEVLIPNLIFSFSPHREAILSILNMQCIPWGRAWDRSASLELQFCNKYCLRLTSARRFALKEEIWEVWALLAHGRQADELILIKCWISNYIWKMASMNYLSLQRQWESMGPVLYLLPTGMFGIVYFHWSSGLQNKLDKNTTVTRKSKPDKLKISCGKQATAGGLQRHNGYRGIKGCYFNSNEV